VWGGVPVGVLLLLLLILAVGTQNRCVMSQKLKKTRVKLVEFPSFVQLSLVPGSTRYITGHMSKAGDFVALKTVVKPERLTPNSIGIISKHRHFIDTQGVHFFHGFFFVKDDPKHPVKVRLPL
jgi:hypothetical protein